MFIHNHPLARSLLAVAALLACVTAQADATGAWTRLPDLPTARLAAGAVAFEGRLYVIGGCVVRDGQVYPSGAVEVYSPVTGTWTTKASLPTPRSNFGITVANGRIFVIGGTLTDTTSQTDVVDVYDPIADRWSSATPMPTARSQVGAAMVDGKIYAIGGNARHQHTFERYDPATDHWSSLPPLANPRRDAGVAVLDGKIYVCGGVGNDARYAINRLEVYDPIASRWSECATANVARCDSALVTLGSALVAVAGWNRGPIASVEEYVPATGTWVEREPLPVPTQFHCAAVLDGKIYLFGGTHRLPTATNDAWVWSPGSAE